MAAAQQPLETTTTTSTAASADAFAWNRKIVPVTPKAVKGILSRHLGREVDVSQEALKRYQQAMVHNSYTIESHATRAATNAGCPPGVLPFQAQSYERLEYLGDSVLGMIVASYLFARYPTENEGFLSKMRTHLVNGRMLASLCMRHTSLPQHVAISRQMEATSEAACAQDDAVASTAQVERNAKRALPRGVLEDVLEAFIGALFLDHGYDVASQWVVAFLERSVDFAALAARQDTPRAVLNRYCQSSLGFLPTLHVISEKAVRLVTPDGAVISTGCGSSRRDAEDVATWKALQYYGLRK
jgi:ribonuclease-3